LKQISTCFENSDGDVPVTIHQRRNREDFGEQSVFTIAVNSSITTSL
jgi:hypothetical protein